MRLARLAAIAGCIGMASFMATPASAQTFRCNGNLASLGDTKASVSYKCGEPAAKDTFCKPANPSHDWSALSSPATRGTVLPCQTVDEWTYRPGPGQFVTTLRFEDGALKDIRSGDRIQ
jgi:hypothetical protein